jgi:hypothetical protein
MISMSKIQIDLSFDPVATKFGFKADQATVLMSSLCMFMIVKTGPISATLTTFRGTVSSFYVFFVV